MKTKLQGAIHKNTQKTKSAKKKNENKFYCKKLYTAFGMMKGKKKGRRKEKKRKRKKEEKGGEKT